MDKKFNKSSGFVCEKCGKDCGNAGLLAMHLKSPARKYRAAHRQWEKAMEK